MIKVPEPQFYTCESCGSSIYPDEFVHGEFRWPDGSLRVGTFCANCAIAHDDDSEGFEQLSITDELSE